jgi:hypothetical protein
MAIRKIPNLAQADEGAATSDSAAKAQATQ